MAWTEEKFFSLLEDVRKQRSLRDKADCRQRRCEKQKCVGWNWGAPGRGGRFLDKAMAPHLRQPRARARKAAKGKNADRRRKKPKYRFSEALSFLDGVKLKLKKRRQILLLLLIMPG